MADSSVLSRFDHYFRDDGPAALVIRESLVPVEGPDAVLFPPTFAASPGGFPGGYNIDTDAQGRSVCLIDSVGSQANRIEPLFKTDKYKHLVPQIVLVAGDHRINLLEAGHRAGDALLRCSSLGEELQNAFRDALRGNAETLARIAPTSLVFGVWDSRDTQVKFPRVVASTIRAFNVRVLTRGAVYIPPVDYTALDVFTEDEKAKAEGNQKSPLAQRGFVHNPASHVPGGVIAEGGIRRDATLGISALRQLYAGRDEDKTLALRRYILGLSLVAFTSRPDPYLRQGCTLVLDPNQPREFVEVHGDGRREPCNVTHDDALRFATEAAREFRVGEDRTVPFEKERAKQDVKTEKPGKPKPKRGDKGTEDSPDEAEHE